MSLFCSPRLFLLKQRAGCPCDVVSTFNFVFLYFGFVIAADVGAVVTGNDGVRMRCVSSEGCSCRGLSLTPKVHGVSRHRIWMGQIWWNHTFFIQTAGNGGDVAG